AAGYLSAFTAEGVERNLENLYGTTKSNRLEREALAPFVLLHLDRTLRSVPGEKGGFDSVLARMFHGRTPPSLWSSLPQGRPGLLLLDAGSAVIRPEKQEKPDFFSRREQSLYLRLMDFMRYGAAVVGTTELSFGLEHFREMTHGIRTPYLSANILENGKRVASAWTLLLANGLRVAVIGLFEPLRGKSADPLFE